MWIEPAQYDFTIYQGATFRRELRMRIPGGVFDFSDLIEARMQIRESRDSTTVLAELTTGGGEIFVTEGGEVLNLYLAPAQTETLDFTKAVYDLEIELPNSTGSGPNDVFRLIQGCARLSREVTRNE